MRWNYGGHEISSDHSFMERTGGFWVETQLFDESLILHFLIRAMALSDSNER
jgi:hypothetical protein